MRWRSDEILVWRSPGLAGQERRERRVVCIQQNISQSNLGPAAELPAGPQPAKNAGNSATC